VMLLIADAAALRHEVADGLRVEWWAPRPHAPPLLLFVIGGLGEVIGAAAAARLRGALDAAWPINRAEQLRARVMFYRPDRLIVCAAAASYVGAVAAGLGAIPSSR
jgi:hypothetical protein